MAEPIERPEVEPRAILAQRKGWARPRDWSRLRSVHPAASPFSEKLHESFDAG